MIYLFSSSPDTIEQFFLEKRLPYQLVTKETFTDFVKSYHDGKDSNDLGIVYDFGEIVPESLLAKLLMLNIHFSLLPKYRGATPVEAAILNGETETGITVQKMEQKMDAGDILYTRKVVINPSWSAGELQLYMDSLLPEILKMVFDTSPEKWNFTPQKGEPTFCYKSLLDRENAQLDFETMTAEEIERKVRAFNPEPLAWVRVERNGKPREMNIIRAKVYPELVLSPKQLQFVKKQGLAVGTKSVALLITELVIAGSKAMRDGDIVALKGALTL